LKEIGKTLDQIDRQVPQKQLESDRLEQLLAETALIRNDNVKSEATVQEWQMDRIFVNEETIWDGAGQDKVDLDDVLIWALKIAVDDRVLKSAPGVRADLREFDWAIEAAPNLLRYAFYLIFSRGMDNTDKALQYRLQRESQMSIGFQFDEQDMGMLKMVVGTNYYQFQQKALVPQPDATGKEMPAILADDKNGHPLALARQILLLLGGELAIENASDGTATVTVTLPYSQLKVNGIETSEPVIALAPEQMDPRKPDILIADDDLVILRTSREQLSSRFNVWVATDGEQAHQAIQQHGPFALIVTDVQMPIRKGTITDGVVLVQTLRREEYRGPISLRTSLNSSDPYLAPLVTGGQISRILPKGIAFEQTLLESVLAILEAFESDQVNQAI
ncbi:MAG: response regulator, partial [Candidatus Omnitrophica bacterium]|nr:response regulator [Candidatus Omnitrophota bacterium]